MWKLKISVILLVNVVLKHTTEADRRIAGGDVVSIEEYPFSTSLLTNGGSGEYRHACGGAILTANAILSAASCFFTDGVVNPVTWWRARVGSKNSNSGGTIHIIRLITPHPDFTSATLDHNVAVLRTSLDLRLTPGLVEAARIAGSAYSLTSNQQVWAIGWGATSNAEQSSSAQLRAVQFWVVEQGACAERYSELNFTLTDNMVCAGWLDVGIRGQCAGDNGSPLLDNVVGGGVVVGVHSWAQGCAQGWYPGVNTRIAPYTRWVVDNAVA